MHYDLGALSLWLGMGAALIVGGVQVAGWRHKALIMGLIGSGAVCVLAAVAWPLLATGWPWLAGVMATIAHSPSSWFTMAVFVAVLILTSRQRVSERAIGEVAAAASDDPTDDLETILGRLNRLEMRQVEHISTPQLAIDLRKEISNAAHEMVGRILKTREEGLRLSDGQQKISIQLATDLQATRETVKQAELDILHIFTFAIDEATLAMVDGCIAAAPAPSKPISELPDYESRVAQRGLWDTYVRDVSRQMDGRTDRALTIASILENASLEAEAMVENTPPDARPVGIDPLEVRRYTIAELRCQRLVAYLMHERGRIAGRVAAARSNLIERRDRNKSY